MSRQTRRGDQPRTPEWSTPTFRTWLRPSGASTRTSFKGKGLGVALSAYSVAIDESHGISIEVCETEELAGATSLPEGAKAPGLTVRTIKFDEVIGSA
jgi:hypothetical protein